MELAELVGLRPVPGAGLLLTVTQRCPLRCAHCSSDSTMEGRAPNPRQLLDFVGSFREDNRPDVLMLTGGEPLLLPELVVELAHTARRAGTRTAVLTGAYFARRTRLPMPILRAAHAVDHFSVSIDAYHEREVPRDAVFRLLRRLIDAGIAVSLHAVGSGADDPYLSDLTGETRRTFGDRVPMLVNTLRPVGRAAGWATAEPVDVDRDRVLPCAMAAWPVVASDGTVVACCNQDAVDRRPVPGHLRLGHIATDDWTAVRDRSVHSPVLRMIRAAGPTYLQARFGRPAGAKQAGTKQAGTRQAGAGPDAAGGYCDGCRRLGERPAVLHAIRRAGSGVVGELLDRRAAQVQVEAGPVDFVRRHGCARYADLVAPAVGAGRHGGPA